MSCGVCLVMPLLVSLSMAVNGLSPGSVCSIPVNLNADGVNGWGATVVDAMFSPSLVGGTGGGAGARIGVSGNVNCPDENVAEGLVISAGSRRPRPPVWLAALCVKMSKVPPLLSANVVVRLLPAAGACSRAASMALSTART